MLPRWPRLGSRTALRSRVESNTTAKKKKANEMIPNDTLLYSEDQCTPQLPTEMLPSGLKQIQRPRANHWSKLKEPHR